MTYISIVEGLSMEAASPQDFAELLTLIPPSDTGDQLAIYENLSRLQTAADWCERIGMQFEHMRLLRLSQRVHLTPLGEDYAFRSDTDISYVYSHLVTAFRLNTSNTHLEDADAAWIQLQEHLVAHDTASPLGFMLIDAAQLELAEGIARAYGCEIVVL